MGGLQMPKTKGAAAMLQDLNSEEAPQVTENERSNETPNVITNVPSNEPTSDTSFVPAVQTDDAKPSPLSDRETRYHTALLKADEDEVAVVTVRAPTKLNEYVDKYVARVNQINPKRKYRKQDAIAEMFAAFYADHPMPAAPAETEEL